MTINLKEDCAAALREARALIAVAIASGDTLTDMTGEIVGDYLAAIGGAVERASAAIAATRAMDRTSQARARAL